MRMDNGELESTLLAAVLYFDLSTVKYLIDHGADVNARLHRGAYDSTLSAAAHMRRDNCVRLLLEE